MFRPLSLSIFAFVAACAGEKPIAPALSARAASADAAAVPIKDPHGQPIVRNGMRAYPLGSSARITFAKYLNAMHDRIHPEFSDKELRRFEALPAEDPSNDKKLATRLELVLNAENGHIVKIGVAKPSGIAAFDAAALDSVQRAQPFGSASQAIVSADNFVYVDWEFRRDEHLACSTMFSRAFIFAP